MPETPNNKMDELLRKHAEKRRHDASGFSLHPATRRLLHGEVQRQLPKSGAASGSPRSWFGVLLAWRGAAVAACGLVAILAAGVWFFGRDQAERPARAEATFAKLEDAPKPLPPTDTLARKSAAEPESLRSQPETPSLAKAPAAPAPSPAAAPTPSPALAGAAGDSPPNVNFKGGRADTKAKAELAAAEKKMALKDAEVSSLTPAPTPASTPAASAAVADFDQAAISAKQQQVAQNTSDKAMALNNDTTLLNSQSQVANAGQFRANSPAGGAASAVQNSALLNNQQQQLALNAPAPPPAPAQQQQYFRNSQVLAAGAEANAATVNNAAPQEMAAQTQRLNALRENVSTTQAAQLGATAATQTRAALGNVTQMEERQSRDEAAPAGVLTHFVVQQRGNSVRVIDADSSVYDGTLFEDSVANATQPSADTYDAARQLDRSAARQRMFRVIGTNKTSGQSVVLDAQLPPASSTQQTFVVIQPVELSRSRSAGAAQTIPAVPTVPSTTRLKPSRPQALSDTNVVLEGSLRVGGAASQQIRARRISQ